MPQDDDQRYTYNELSNEDKALLLGNGYKPGELSPEEARELIADLRNQSDNDEDSDHLSTSISADERDGTE
jgi:polyhydroxyalkanoate synthesis regulator phasin